MKNLLLTLLLIPIASFAQLIQDSIFDVANYDWEKSPVYEAQSEDEIIILKKVIYLHQDYDEEGRLIEEKITHQITWIGDENEVDSWNKVYLPMGEEDESIRIKARVIQANGEIQELDDDDIQEGKDDDGDEYKYFALSGVQKGVLVETFFHTIEDPYIMGTKYKFQGSAEVRNLDFQFVCPFNLIYKFKSYNDLPEAQQVDSMLTKQNRWVIKADVLESLKPEEHAHYTPYLASMVYGLDENTFNGKKDICSFSYTAKNVYANANPELSKKVKKGFKKIVKEIDLDESMDARTKVLKVEDYIKSNYIAFEASGESLSDLEKIMDQKVMNKFGAMVFYHQLLKAAGINNELVLTSDKSYWPFDPDFETRFSISHILVYCVEADVFIDPLNMISRIGFYSTDYQNTEGLFITEFDLGGEKIGLGETRPIKGMTAEENYSELEINWTIDVEEGGSISAKKTDLGIAAKGYQNMGRFVQEEDEKEWKEEPVKHLFPNVEFTSFEIENLSSDQFGINPLITSATFSDEEYIEEGTSSWIVKIGDIIGKQSEWYQKDSLRKLPVYVGYPRKYKHVISISIPEGFTLKNLESLNMLVTSNESDPSMKFECTYTYENNVLTVEINEWYKKESLPKSEVDVYRDVINAAADFNKKFLILERTNP